MSSLTLFTCLLFFKFTVIMHKTIAAPTVFKWNCSFESFNPNDNPYASNLRNLFASLALESTHNSKADGLFSGITVGLGGRPIYGQSFCRGDYSIDDCKKCVANATKNLSMKCPVSISAQIWYEDCAVRYSNVKFFGVYNEPSDPIWFLEDKKKGAVVDNNPLIEDFVVTTMEELAEQVASSDNNVDEIQSLSLGRGRIKYYGTKEVNLTTNNTSYPQNVNMLYEMVQCTPDLSVRDCSICLRSMISQLLRCCSSSLGARVVTRSCFIRYATYSFYNVSPPILFSRPPTLMPPKTHPSGTISFKVVIAITIPAATLISLTTLAIGICVIKAKKNSSTFPISDESNDRFDTADSLQYDIKTLRAATKNFSDANKIGRGGFGCVYRGTLPNGQKIAIKKLFKRTSQNEEEFQNEVDVVAKLQHRNLVRLLGFCLTKDEKLLVFEYVPNKSLDKLLFDKKEQARLDWLTRFNIIIGIARGLLYMHEESRDRIVHRDLKPANILLDEQMNPKIADFGLARIFGIKKKHKAASNTVGTSTSSGIDPTHQSTRRGGGTPGYMAPECAYRGQFSVKTDVYSFGVMILETISGKRNTCFYQSGLAEDLLSYSWMQWRAGAPLTLIDEVLVSKKGYLSDEMRDQMLMCIHLGLLCVQRDPKARPTMAIVVQKLNFCMDNSLLPLPQQAFSPLPQQPPEKAFTYHDSLVSDVSYCSFSSEFDPR